MKIKQIEIFSIAAHIEQIVTGILLLREQRVVSVEKVSVGNYHGAKPEYGPYLKVHIDNDILLFDTSDNFEIVNNKGVLHGVTHYFKRSFALEGYPEMPFKMFPLGLNNLVYGRQPNICTVAQMKFASSQGQLSRYVGRYNGLLSKVFTVNSSVENRNHLKFKDIYQTKKEDLILFNTRLWNPKTAKSKKESERREVLNDRRIEFVNRLQKTFGSRFVGGIFNNDVAREICPNSLIVQEKADYQQKKYQTLLRKAKVGISVNGNHAAGWSFAEFCAFGVGIVCDPITVKLPGTFRHGDHYLSVNDTDELIASCDMLLAKSDEKYRKMRANNYRYYHAYIKPDSMVFNALIAYKEC